MFILGEREVEQSTVSVRKHKHGDQGVMSQSEALKQLNEEITTKALPTIPN
jgi:threonyl-tRNA synthetase